jgi:cobalt-zinc-cadmium efflux system outer membrane protein
MFTHARRRAGWLVASVCLASCATTGASSFEDRTFVDSRPRSSVLASDDVHDAELAGPVLGHAEYVEAVLRRNPSVEAARQAWRAAIARARQSGVLDDPMVSADIAPLSIGSPRARLGWDAMASQRLPWPGKLGLDEAVSRAEADAAKSDFEAARRELALTASLLFDDYFASVRSIEINAHHVALMRQMQAAATAQYEAGRGSARDPLQAEFELTHMEHDTVILASQRDVTIAEMNELLHRAPDAPLPPPPAELSVGPSLDSTEAPRLETQAVAQRPDIAAARAHARAAQARADRGRRESLPDFIVSTAYNSMWDTPEHRWTVGLSFNLPLPNGRREGAVDEANAMRAEYEANAARMSDAARTQVAVALKRLEESKHVLHLMDDRLLPIARDEVDAARAAFTVSQAPFVAVVDAEKNLRGVELDREMALADSDRRRAELDRALGRIPGIGQVDAPGLHTKEVTP